MPYVVWEGKTPGVYETWEEAREQVHGYRGAKFKKFKTIEDALAAFHGVTVADVFCDASYRQGKLSIRIVDNDGKLLHSDIWGVQEHAINIGEFIAAIRALQLTDGVVATDSQVAYQWIQAGTVNTKLLLPTPLHEALHQALSWLKQNPEAKPSVEED
jgi:Predicted double-stranded RNA/RNA-DNA hybrid binding protein